MPYLHLAHGATVIPRHDHLLLATSDERFAAITGTPAELPVLAEVLLGGRLIPDAGTGSEVAAAVVDWGAARTDTAPRTDAPSWRLADLVPMAGLQAGLDAHPSLDDPVLVVADVLDDALLAATDASAAARPWLPVHRELGALVVGPVLNGHTGNRLTWADVRFRRLAASTARTELSLLWETWSAHGTAYDVVPPAEALRVAAARLLEWLPEHGGLLASHQVVVPCHDGAPPSAHPVLPVPQGLMDQVPV